MNIEAHAVNFATKNAPNSKYPVLIYRNVLSEAMTDCKLTEAERESNTARLFEANHWTPDVCAFSTPMNEPPTLVPSLEVSLWS